MNNLCRLIEESYLEELDALKKRQKALSLGIVPAQGTNWKAALKNKKLQEKVGRTRSNVENFDSLYATDKPTNYDTSKTSGFKNIPYWNEYGGVVGSSNGKRNNEFIPTDYGNDHTVSFQNFDLLKNKASLHTHPAISQKSRDYAMKNLVNGKDDPNYEELQKIFNERNNNIVAAPSNLDLESYKDIQEEFKQPFREDYVATPDIAYSPLSMIRTTPSHQKTTFFARDAGKYFDLNGRLKNPNFNNYEDPINQEFRKQRDLNAKINLEKNIYGILDKTNLNSAQRLANLKELKYRKMNPDIYNISNPKKEVFDKLENFDNKIRAKVNQGRDNIENNQFYKIQNNDNNAFSNSQAEKEIYNRILRNQIKHNPDLRLFYKLTNQELPKNLEQYDSNLTPSDYYQQAYRKKLNKNDNFNFNDIVV